MHEWLGKVIPTLPKHYQIDEGLIKDFGKSTAAFISDNDTSAWCIKSVAETFD